MSEITQADIELDTDRHSVKLDNSQINWTNMIFLKARSSATFTTTLIYWRKTNGTDD